MEIISKLKERWEAKREYRSQQRNSTLVQLILFAAMIILYTTVDQTIHEPFILFSYTLSYT